MNCECIEEPDGVTHIYFIFGAEQLLQFGRQLGRVNVPHRDDLGRKVRY